MNNNIKPKYHYIQIISDWDLVRDYVNNKGYEIYNMCSMAKEGSDVLVYLLRKELNDGPKEIT